jgi:hypothetical protein
MGHSPSFSREVSKHSKVTTAVVTESDQVGRQPGEAVAPCLETVRPSLDTAPHDYPVFPDRIG